MTPGGQDESDPLTMPSQNSGCIEITCNGCKESLCLGHAVTKWFDDFFTAVVTVGTLGAGFTFSVIFSGLETFDRRERPVDTNTVRHFLIVAWLLFVLSVAVASIGASTFGFASEKFIKGFNDYEDWVTIVAAVITIVLQLLIVGAFWMSARAMRRYDEDSGKAAVGIIITIGCVLIGLWFVKIVKDLDNNRKKRIPNSTGTSSRDPVSRDAANERSGSGSAA